MSPLLCSIRSMIPLPSWPWATIAESMIPSGLTIRTVGVDVIRYNSMID